MLNFKKNRDWIEHLTIVMQVGLTMAGCIIFCFFIGLNLDTFMGTRGLFVTILTLLGIMGGGNVSYRQILEITEEKKLNSENRENDIRNN